MQLFLHKKLDYRGVVLFPWVARVFNRNNKAFPSMFDRLIIPGNIALLSDNVIFLITQFNNSD